MTVKLIYIFALIIVLSSCEDGGNRNGSKVKDKKNLRSELFEIEFHGVDTCTVLRSDDTLISAFREIEIIKNSMSDTVVFGTSLLLPQYTGEFLYLQIDNRRDITEYPETGIMFMSRTSMLCIHPTPFTKANGRIQVKVYY